MAAINLFILIVLILELGVLKGAENPCKGKGLMCMDCKTLGKCTPLGTTNFLYEKETKVCNSNLVCDQFALSCTSGKCRYKDFECPESYEKEELFPDPYFCRNYYGCKGTQRYRYTCPDEEKAFNPDTKRCNLPINSTTCGDYIVLCQEDGQTGFIGSNYKYECLEEGGVIYPKLTLSNEVTQVKEMHQMRAMETVSTIDTESTSNSAPTDHSDTTGNTESIETSQQTENSNPTGKSDPTGKSEPTEITEATDETETPEVSTGQSDLTTENSETIASSPGDGTTEQGTSPDITPTTPYPCNSEGLFEDKADCTMYYACILVGGKYIVEHKQCRRGTYFDPARAQCVRGTCVTTTTPASTKPTTPTPPCSEEGYFPAPDCHCYVYCYLIDNSHYGNSTECCRRGLYFDNSRKSCVIGSC